MPYRRAWLCVAAALLSIPACGSDDGEETAAPRSEESSTTSSSVDASSPPPDVEPGHAVVEAGGQRLTFIVFDCLVGDETGAPNRRLALSASNTEPFAEASEVLNVDILVSRATGQEEHIIAITRRDRASLGASDTPTPSRGGRAPDDWIEVDEENGAVHGDGFELRATDGSGDVLPAGRLVADCP